MVSSDMTIDSMENDITNCAKLVMFGPEKRRRSDEVITHSVATEVVVKGLAVSSAAFARCNPSLFARSDGAFVSCDLKHMRAYLSAAWLNFHDSEFVSIAYDGFRAGFPVVENLGIAVYDVDRQRSAWAPLMDRHSQYKEIQTSKAMDAK